MGRTPTPFGAPHRRPRLLDRSARGELSPASTDPRDPPPGPQRTRPVLPGPTPATAASPLGTAAPLQNAIELQELWYQLSMPERHRFGRCFSGMVLKVLGQHAAPLQGVDA